MPIGRPPLVKPDGTVSDGRPRKFTGRVNSVSRCNSAGAFGPPPTSLSSIVGAGTGDAGAMTASTPAVAALYAASAGPRQRIASR